MPTVSVINAENECQDFEIKEEEVIYDGVESHGVELPHGCLAGSCGSCKVEVLEGADLLKAPSLIEQNTIDNVTASLTEKKGADFVQGKIIRLSCRARVIADGKVVIKPITN